MNTNQKQIVHALTEEILSDVGMLEGERHHPGFDPDRMDERIKALQDRVRTLRSFREDLELAFNDPRI